VPKREALKKKILDEANTSRYSIHLGSTKMYHDLRQQFWWMRMKREAARYVSECDTYRKVKANYKEPGGLLQPVSIPEWKWDDISIDFIVGLPMMACKFDSIWVIVDRLSKSAHFIPVNTKYDNLRPRFTVCYSLLGATACVPRNPFDPQFSLSPIDGWPN
jgi:hypothetical protein